MGVTRKPSNHTEASGGVDSVENVDGSLTISPETGNVVASLNVANANAWTADQSFNDNVAVTLGTGGDADIFYDGTDVIFDAQVVGTGVIVFTGDVQNSSDSTYNVGSNTVRFLNVFTDQCQGGQFRASAANLLGTDGFLVSAGAMTDIFIQVNSGIITSISIMK
jgi:hypothetical protein